LNSLRPKKLDAKSFAFIRKQPTALRNAVNRMGAATVELAIGLVPLVTIFVGVVDTCQIIYLKEDATTIAYECTRLAARPNVTLVDIERRANSMFRDRNIEGGSVIAQTTLNPNGISRCQVTINIPEAKNLSFSTLNFQRNIQIKRSTIREQFNYD